VKIAERGVFAGTFPQATNPSGTSVFLIRRMKNRPIGKHGLFSMNKLIRLILLKRRQKPENYHGSFADRANPVFAD
jgi:hypothetical protein